MLVRATFFVCGVLLVTPWNASAQWQPWGGEQSGCQSCQAAAPVAMIPQVMVAPMALPSQACLTTQQMTTYRDVVETQHRVEKYVEQVPVTTMENVTVDEGGYQMVWVPKPVTRQMAKTVMTTQEKTRSVPVHIVRRIPQQTTHIVAAPIVSVPLVAATSVYDENCSVPPAAPLAWKPMPEQSVRSPRQAAGAMDDGWTAIPPRSNMAPVKKQESQNTEAEDLDHQQTPGVRRTSSRSRPPTAAAVWTARGPAAFIRE